MLREDWVSGGWASSLCLWMMVTVETQWSVGRLSADVDQRCNNQKRQILHH